jgi:hypothetical protein
MEVFKVGALVVWRGQVVPVVNRWVHPDGTIYMVHTRARDGRLVSELVTFGQLVAEMDRCARWCVGDKVEFGPWDKYVKARWWSTRRGEVVYRINDFLDEGRTGLVIPQSELVKRIEGHEVQNT